MRTFRASQCGFDFSEVELENLGVFQSWRSVGTEQALSLHVSFYEFYLFFRSASAAQVTQCFIVDGEVPHRRAILRSHVGDRSAVSQRHARDTRAKELDELANHTFFAKHFGDAKYQVRGCRAFRQLAVNFEADHFWHQHIKRLPEHSGFCFNTADTPTQNSETVDHRGVAIRTHERIRQSDRSKVIVAYKDTLRQILKVDLVNNACVRWNDSKIIKGLLAPTQELITFLIAFKFDFHVLGE